MSISGELFDMSSAIVGFNDDYSSLGANNEEVVNVSPYLHVQLDVNQTRN